MNLLYITFGANVSVHSQAAFSICSFLSQKKLISSINIITDAPDYYTHLRNEVTITPIDDAILQEWKGPHDFFWRIKIKAIERICAQYAGQPVVYLDTDTFLYHDGNQLQQLLAEGYALMHENEGLLSQQKGKTARIMHYQINNRSFGGLVMNNAACMWNAGVVATPNTKQGYECQLALRICDDMCAAGVTRRLVEQFALSVALAEVYTLKPAVSFIAHYWSNKEEWNQRITDFFTEAYCKQYNRDELIAAFSTIDITTLPVKRIKKNTAGRLHHLVDTLFQPKEIVHLKNRSNDQ